MTLNKTFITIRDKDGKGLCKCVFTAIVKNKVFTSKSAIERMSDYIHERSKDIEFHTIKTTFISENGIEIYTSIVSNEN